MTGHALFQVSHTYLIYCFLAKQRLKLDNEREYFLSGQVDTLIYDPDCEFADPFVSFNGRDR